MAAISLTTRRIPLKNGASALSIDFNGEEVLINDTASNAVEIYLLFQDKDTPEEAKAAEIIKKLFVSPAEAYLACDYSIPTLGDLINMVMLEVFGIDTRKDSTPSSAPELFDIETDAAYIRSSLRMSYGIDWDAVRDSISWSEFLSLIWSLPYETPLGFRMFYRDPSNRPTPNKHNSEQVKEFDKYAALFSLDNQQSSHDNAKDANSAMTDVALSLAALA